MPRRADGLAPDGVRSAIAGALAYAVAAAAVATVLISRGWDGLAELLAVAIPALGIGMLVFVAVAAVSYVVFTARAFSGVPAADLPTLLSPGTVPRWQRIVTAGSSDGPAVAVFYAAIALVGAVVVARLDPAATDAAVRAPVVGAAVVGVVACWALLVTTYAVHYARVHQRAGGRNFPGAEAPTFGDYVYFSVSVGTTLGTTDVQVNGRRMRRVVTAHALVSLGYNTVILALVLSTLTA